ncbi:hypothetical protein LINGRAHAP2_LOCUS1704 [Linum grandiflorum]
MNPSQPQHLSNKKLATDTVKHNLAQRGNHYPWLQRLSDQKRGHLFGTQLVQRSHPSAGSTASMIMGPKEHVNGSYMGLSITHNLEDHSVSVEHGSDSNKDLCTLMKHSNSGSSNSSITLGPKSDISIGRICSKADGNFISLGHNLNQGDGYLMPMACGNNNNKESGLFLSMEQPATKAKHSSIPMAGIEIITNLIKMNPYFGGSGFLSLGHNYGDNANENTGSSFGAFCGTNINASGASNGGYGLSFPGCSSGQGSAQVESQKKNLVQTNADAVAANRISKYNFPANVKTLMSTGILDDIAVKYVSWSREKSLRGIISGTGYLCGCIKCNYRKNVNAYEFERHANCQTRHPTNHIYFNNGKTIYGVVQELKNTPQEKLFDVVHTVTGSQINQKNFLSWKGKWHHFKLRL